MAAFAASSLPVAVPLQGASTKRLIGAATSRKTQLARPTTTCMATKKESAEIIFSPFQEVKPELAAVSKVDNSVESFARSHYEVSCEVALNEQINVEYNISYIYHSLYAFFDRDNVGLPGFAEYFRKSSEEEREHAEKLMVQQNRRGGRVKLHSILLPETEFNHKDKGDALYAMELALSLEKLNFTKLRELHRVACNAEDAQLADFIEGHFLQEQAEAIKTVSEYVSQLRRVGKGLGVFEFDKYLTEQDGAAA
ncbi:ferritin-like protein [Coccomyxa subellipsoidea C-169]|uniref:Ferritin n=1 Tax=Coccomyxa subellipsoidea (strain C-169) TaxID=574566 RepID=I0YP34_COCSC|nr:ferritin-like protein [Coccomyxa subellipsoidea C-169]EIE20153.1 ferritin-like protein [Coccomyxa subellipsoidea C-169]|eukprot:XP_005644697.1 ferritin-like protein [Coccomyxa subellipsoidea C-169]